MLDSKEAAKITALALADKKGEDIKVINISQISSLADYFIIATGNNPSQIQAMSDHVTQKLTDAGMQVKQTEGYNNATWILTDFGDIMVHVFNKESRSYYNLERIWRDGKFEELI